MRARLHRLAAAVEERQRPLQATLALGSITAGVCWVAHPGWGLVVLGGLLLADVVAERLPGRRARP
jgi:hypothetical protein